MIQVDFTNEVVEVTSDGEAEGGIRLITGCDAKGTEGCWQTDTRKEVAPRAGAKVSGLGVTAYAVRERYLHERGGYEIQSQVRRGAQRKFLLDVVIEDKLISLNFKVGSDLAYWIIDEQPEPVRQKPGEDLVLNFEDSRQDLWERLADGDLV